MIRAACGRQLRHVRILLAAVLVAALLGGCVTPRGKTVYEKPGVTDEQQKKDEAQCVQAALDTAGAGAATPLPPGPDAGGRCMPARRHSVTRPQKPPRAAGGPGGATK